MKKIVLIVPDAIKHLLGGSTSDSNEVSKEVTPENILNVLRRRNDYHEDFYFDELDKIKILSIENYDENSG